MYKKLRCFSFIPVLLLVSLLAACGSNGGSTSSTNSGSAGNSSPTSTTTTTTTSSNTHNAQGPITSVRMLDKAYGWALTKNSILTTTDGGQSWQDVTPADGPTSYQLARGDFLTRQTAWVATAQQDTQTVTVERTTDGGAHWQSAKITVPDLGGVDMPHFLNTSEGWLEVMGSPGAGQEGAYFYHSTDGGATWQQLGATPNNGMANAGFKSGISPLNKQVFFATTSNTTGQPTDPGVYISSDGAKTWQKKTIPAPRGLENLETMGTTPPIFSGNTGLLPVYITTQDGQHLLNLYYSEDGGANWMPRGNASLDASTVYVLDTSHAWAADSQNGKLAYTTDGGVSWQVISAPGKISELSFINASIGWAVTDTALLHTTDGGKTWTPLAATIK